MSLMRSTTKLPRHRLGISLLEVMISVGIVSISIFGLLALLPVAGQQAERGLINDRASTAGRNATSVFVSRGMHRQENWLFSSPIFQPASGPPTFLPTDPPNLGQFATGISLGTPTGLQTYFAFCIDPQIVSRYGIPWNSTPEPVFNFPATPDQSISNLNTIPRITLRSQVHFHDTTNNVIKYFPLNIPQSDYLFTSGDDLIFNKNEELQNTVDPTAPLLPIQQLGGTNAVRQSEGTISWMATMAPAFPLNPLTVPPSSNVDYILSIVVFHNRDLTHPAAMSVDPVEVASPERVGFIAPGDFFSQGVGGGDLAVSKRSASHPDIDIDLRKGQWVMLIPQVTASGVRVPYCRWYRVIDADYEGFLDSDGNFKRNVTLDGPDWPYNNLPTVPNTELRDAFRSPQVVIPTGVVSVFERTVRLEGTTAWAD